MKVLEKWTGSVTSSYPMRSLRYRIRFAMDGSDLSFLIKTDRGFFAWVYFLFARLPRRILWCLEVGRDHAFLWHLHSKSQTPIFLACNAIYILGVKLIFLCLFNKAHSTHTKKELLSGSGLLDRLRKGHQLKTLFSSAWHSIRLWP